VVIVSSASVEDIANQICAQPFFIDKDFTDKEIQPHEAKYRTSKHPSIRVRTLD
jgi:hypothetical protein